MSVQRVFRRARFYAGNCVRAATIPWKQHRISPAEASTVFGSSFGAHGWHHLRRTLEEYDANPAIGYRDTSLFRFLSRFRPNSVCELLREPVGEENHLPLFVYPWGTFRRGEVELDKDPRESRFCGPSSDKFIAAEFRRTIGLYESMKDTGYQPWRFDHTFIGGTLLRAANRQRRFVVLQGNHRMAILAHLGVAEVLVRDCRGYHPVISEAHLEKWPLVASGVCSAALGRAIFHMFFMEDGSHIRGIIEEGASAQARSASCP